MKNLVALAPVLGAILRPDVDVEIDDEDTRIFPVFELRIRMNEFDHEWHFSTAY